MIRNHSWVGSQPDDEAMVNSSKSGRVMSWPGMLLLAVVLGSSAAAAADLNPPQAFDGIADRATRSRALFMEAAKVFEHPRCQNCHPVGDRPSQGNADRPHLPLVVRGPDGHGAVGMRCDTCHQAANFEPSGAPGHPEWRLAKVSMGWQKKSPGRICQQIKDPQRNGGKSLAQIQDHIAHDGLVGWAWAPGGDREPAPGSQARLGDLISAWIATGASCPRP